MKLIPMFCFHYIFWCSLLYGCGYCAKLFSFTFYLYFFHLIYVSSCFLMLFLKITLTVFPEKHATRQSSRSEGRTNRWLHKWKVCYCLFVIHKKIAMSLNFRGSKKLHKFIVSTQIFSIVSSINFCKTYAWTPYKLSFKDILVIQDQD